MSKITGDSDELRYGAVRGKMTQERIDNAIDDKLEEVVKLMFRYDMTLTQVNQWFKRGIASFQFMKKCIGEA